jgi:Cd2+/Zn2+-exporting ATPase
MDGAITGGTPRRDGRFEWRVEGMDCPTCAAKVETAVGRLPGVSDVSVSAVTERLALRLAPGGASPEDVERAAAAVGHPARRIASAAPAPPAASPGDEVAEWRVEGMDCPSCLSKIETAVGRLPGVSDVTVSMATERLRLRLVPGGATPEDVERATAAVGHPARRIVPPPPPAAGPGPARPAGGDDDDPGDDARPWWATAKGRLAIALGAAVGAAYALAWLAPPLGLYAEGAAALLGLWFFGRRALAAARGGTPFSIETLVTVATAGALVIGAAGEAALVVFLFAVGELLENVAAGRARAGIRALVDLMPRTARRERADGSFEEVPAARLAVGDVVQIRPGDRVPCDGEILEGRSALDESPVTGESVPVARGPGEPVVAGSVNADGVLRARVVRAAADNTVARIVRMVEEATASRAPTQRFIERFSAWWTPAALVVSALVVLVPPLLFGGDWWTWIYRGLALLLVACPCALVISVPAAMASGLSAGARRGLLIKGGAALETIGAARTVAFDKTGTLTEGRPKVTDVVTAGDWPAGEVLALAAAAEGGSAHPLAKAILAEAEARGVAVPPATDQAAVPGKAVVATVGGRRIAVGSPRHAAEAGGALPDALASRVAALEGEGKTVAVVAADGRPLGLVALRDEPRADAAEGVAALRRLGVGAVMLTGDNERTGRAIAAGLGLDVRAQLLPEDKLREIAALKAAGPVAMVGDGINDAPALAAASVGVAMGGGTDVALETADAALLRERVGGVAELVALSRATMGNVRQNVAIALGLKAVFLVTTLTGVTGLWIAILADTGATILVTLNALRLLRWKGQA